ncbi:MAG: HDOD domain-containing protein [Solidesulfovibrio sp. DCME]|uniref:HDOD domain-containing protein n=1 Tax=Solidesulfovibrio sp. DCME TaxID=3447380 RepID=UPI003D142EC4
MAKVPIDELQPGLVLGADVCGKNGRMLLSAGTVLLPNHLRVLRIWGVSAVCLAPGGEPPATAVPDAGGEAAPSPNDVWQALDARFVLTDRAHPAVAALYGFCLRDLARADRCPVPAVAPPPVEAGEAEPLPPGPEALVADDPSLASFPDIYFRLREAIDDPGASAGRIAGIIGDDPSLAARLLRLANSPFYGLARPIDSLARGVMRIGAGELAQLALGVAVVDRFRDIPSCCLTMRQIWEHAVGCGALARVLGAHVGGLSQERLFVAGLLHDLGRLVLLRRLPRTMSRAMRLAWERGEPLVAAERALLGFDHAAVGRALLAQWHLPPELASAVGGHHLAGGADLDAAIVHVADVATVALGLGSNGSPLVPPLDGAAWERLGIEPSLLAVALSQARRQVDDIVASLVG